MTQPLFSAYLPSNYAVIDTLEKITTFSSKQYVPLRWHSESDLEVYRPESEDFGIHISGHRVGESRSLFWMGVRVCLVSGLTLAALHVILKKDLISFYIQEKALLSLSRHLQLSVAREIIDGVVHPAYVIENFISSYSVNIVGLSLLTRCYRRTQIRLLEVMEESNCDSNDAHNPILWQGTVAFKEKQQTPESTPHVTPKKRRFSMMDFDRRLTGTIQRRTSMARTSTGFLLRRRSSLMLPPASLRASEGGEQDSVERHSLIRTPSHSGGSFGGVSSSEQQKVVHSVEPFQLAWSREDALNNIAPLGSQVKNRRHSDRVRSRRKLMSQMGEWNRKSYPKTALKPKRQTPFTSAFASPSDASAFSASTQEGDGGLFTEGFLKTMFPNGVPKSPFTPMGDRPPVPRASTGRKSDMSLQRFSSTEEMSPLTNASGTPIKVQRLLESSINQQSSKAISPDDSMPIYLRSPSYYAIPRQDGIGLVQMSEQLHDEASDSPIGLQAFFEQAVFFASLEEHVKSFVQKQLKDSLTEETRTPEVTKVKIVDSAYDMRDDSYHAIVVSPVRSPIPVHYNSKHSTPLRPHAAHTPVEPVASPGRERSPQQEEHSQSADFTTEISKNSLNSESSILSRSTDSPAGIKDSSPLVSPVQTGDIFESPEASNARSEEKNESSFTPGSSENLPFHTPPEEKKIADEEAPSEVAQDQYYEVTIPLAELLDDQPLSFDMLKSVLTMSPLKEDKDPISSVKSVRESILRKRQSLASPQPIESRKGSLLSASPSIMQVPQDDQRSPYIPNSQRRPKKKARHTANETRPTVRTTRHRQSVIFAETESSRLKRLSQQGKKKK